MFVHKDGCLQAQIKCLTAETLWVINPGLFAVYFTYVSSKLIWNVCRVESVPLQFPLSAGLVHTHRTSLYQYCCVSKWVFLSSSPVSLCMPQQASVSDYSYLFQGDTYWKNFRFVTSTPGAWPTASIPNLKLQIVTCTSSVHANDYFQSWNKLAWMQVSFRPCQFSCLRGTNAGLKAIKNLFMELGLYLRLILMASLKTNAQIFKP